ncbi:phosphorylase family protein [Luteibaculum oceani]|uniref:Uridine phosphorylase n=1 Tax=Luteibaculum oceani TaxID=1294296 RepID=A0A5C6VE07_9FLAO|nr:phosphorylase [Luteibaculum oceani]TXC81975.1 phosphorylase [Luteibaculum oceani]
MSPNDQWVKTQSQTAAYHINLTGEEISNDIIIVGDPERVGTIGERFDEIHYQKSNREFSSLGGRLNNKQLTVVSSGIGVDNIDILLNEIEHVVNGNSQAKRTLNFYRLGTTGGLQRELSPGSVLISEYAIGIEGLMHYYPIKYSDEEKNLALSFKQENFLPTEIAAPYAVRKGSKILPQFPKAWIKGITLTANGFYGPQLRDGAHGLSKKRHSIEELSQFSFQNLALTNIEMECSGIYGMAKLFNHQAVTICTVIANRITGEIASDIKGATNNLIDHALEVITT